MVARLTDHVDYPFLGMLAFGMFFFAAVGITMALMPPAPENETNEIDERALELLLQKPEPEEKKASALDEGDIKLLKSYVRGVGTGGRRVEWGAASRGVWCGGRLNVQPPPSR